MPSRTVNDAIGASRATRATRDPYYPRDMLTSKEAAHTTTAALILALISGATALIGLLSAY